MPVVGGPPVDGDPGCPLWVAAFDAITCLMKIAELLADGKPTISLEFFPPKTPPGWDRLFRVIRRFERFSPDFVSVTYGAAGTTRKQTHELVRRIAGETGIPSVPHLTCVCHTRDEIETILDQYAQIGIDAIMALGGDAPPDPEQCQSEYGHAIDLVRHISEFNRSGRHPHGGFSVGVAGFPEGHPAAPNRVQEIEYLKQKVDAGADYICTQLFFDNRDFLDFRERCAIAGISVPIVAGIMPVSTRANFERIPSLAAGSRYPAALIRAIDACGDDEAIEEVGVEWATKQCSQLIDEGVAGIHLYTLNRARAIRRVWEALSVT